MMTFQSRFGREPRLMPYTDETLKMLGEKGVGHIQVMCPALLRIVWRRWKRLPSKTVKSSSALAGKIRIYSGA